MYTDNAKFTAQELEGRNFSAPLFIFWEEGDGRTTSAQIIGIKENPDYSNLLMIVTSEGSFALGRSRELHVANPEAIVPNEPKNKFAVVRVTSAFELEYAFIRAHESANRAYPWRSSGGSSYSWVEICAKGTPEILFGGVE